MIEKISALLNPVRYAVVICVNRIRPPGTRPVTGGRDIPYFEMAARTVVKSRCRRVSMALAAGTAGLTGHGWTGEVESIRLVAGKSQPFG